MKKKYILIFTFTLVLLASLFIINNYYKNFKIRKNIERSENLLKRSKIEKSEDMAESLIRFHVLANSDSTIDQDIKIKVKDRVLKEIVPSLRESRNLEESRRIIESSQDKIINLSKEVLKENGMDYNVQTTLGSFSFPAKYYGSFSLPPGQYQAFRIVLGEGKGSNWWCVMFPPLCFVNVETEDNPQEVQESDNPESVEESQPIEIRWKFIELLHSIFNKNTNPKKSGG